MNWLHLHFYTALILFPTKGLSPSNRDKNIKKFDSEQLLRIPEDSKQNRNMWMR